MPTFWTLATLATLTFVLHLAPANAQSRPADNNVYAAIAPYHSPPTSPSHSEQLVISGRITNTTGGLPGAVIILNGTKQMTVTNANGEFEITVPANSGPLPARVTYAGYADEAIVLNGTEGASTVNLANGTVIVVASRQRLKAYLKTARRQVRHDLKRIHAN
jgi:CarboxypepD_reg-like domain